MSAGDSKYDIGTATKLCTKILSGYDQEQPQHNQDDCNTRMDIK